jgi:DNA processing protein
MLAGMDAATRDRLIDAASAARNREMRAALRTLCVAARTLDITSDLAAWQATWGRRAASRRPSRVGNVVLFGDNAYPPLLAAIDDAPPALWCVGDAACLAAPCIAMVGSRRATGVGLATAHALAVDLAGAGIVIASGLAHGIDAASHRGALAAGGRTVAVLACGIDIVYPRAHRDLAVRIARSGAVISEFPPGTPPLAGHFPQRNRIVTGLCSGLVVVEARERSGSLLSARLANEQGRTVMAVPGSVRGGANGGAHRLIREGAALVESAQHVVDEAGLLVTLLERRPIIEQVQPELAWILDALGDEPQQVDDLAARTGADASVLQAGLLALELTGRVHADHHGYRRSP